MNRCIAICVFCVLPLMCVEALRSRIDAEEVYRELLATIADHVTLRS
jgi:hypothetical protein